MTGFHDVRFPDAVARGATGEPEFSTDIIAVASGFEQRNVNWLPHPAGRLDRPRRNKGLAYSTADAARAVRVELQGSKSLINLIEFASTRSRRIGNTFSKGCRKFLANNVTRSAPRRG